MKKTIVFIRKKKLIVASFSLILIISFFIHNLRNKEGTNNYIPNIEEMENHTINTDISIGDDSMIQQWYLENDGSFSSYLYDDESWGFNEKRAKLSIDIDYYKGIQIFSPKRTVIVAVLDTEIDINHYALQDNIWKNTREVDGDNIDNDNNGYIDDYMGWNFCDNNNIIFDKNTKTSEHGTHIVGILGGNDPNLNFRGMLTSSDNKTMCLTVLNEEKGEIEDIIKAIEYAESNGALICCMAFSTYIYNDNLKKTMENSNMLFVVPAGNDGIDTNDLPIYPAAYDINNVISVADIRPDGNLSLTSNLGNNIIDIAAPGTDIVSTISENEYGYLCGSSCSVAFVAGTAALLYCHAEEELSPASIIEILKDSSKKADSIDGKVESGGIVSLYKALNASEKK